MSIDPKDIPPDPEGSSPGDPSYGVEEIKQAILQNTGVLVEKILIKNPEILEIRFDFTFESHSFVTRVTGMTPLIFAAYLGRYTITKLLLSQGANMLTSTKSGGMNAFLATAMKNFLDVGKLIFEAGGPTLLSSQSTGGLNALCFLACKEGVEYAQYLIDQGIDVQIVDQDGETALHSAALGGNLRLIQILLEKDMGLLNMVNSWGQTPLLLAATNRQFDVFRFLLEKGAETSKRDIDNNDVLHIAVTEGHLDSVKTLIERHAGQDQELYLESTGFDAQTPVMMAAWYGHFETFQYLVSKGVDMTKLDASKGTVLHLAVAGANLGIVKSTLENADLSKQPNLIETENEYGDTAFLSAADGGHLEIVQYLVAKGAEVRKTNHENLNALCLAARRGVIEVVRFLVDHTAFGTESISQAMGQDERTPLMLAAQNGMVDVTRYFLQQDADTTKTDIFGNTLLHLAVQATNTDIMEVLLENTSKEEKQIRLGRQNNAGDTPLEAATFHRNVDAMKFLLGQGGKVDAHGKKGENMFQNAALCGYLELVQELVEKRSDLLDHIDEADETGLSFASSGNIEVVE
ncbi:Mg2+ transporter protein CorA-like/Zinc transport protein ZntB [Penicillium herquei]|nr:Mg2+ transporter protein CorA-like/Zinc transport protein ZntB [Penicillium herquei]